MQKTIKKLLKDLRQFQNDIYGIYNKNVIDLLTEVLASSQGDRFKSELDRINKDIEQKKGTRKWVPCMFYADFINLMQRA